MANQTGKTQVPNINSFYDREFLERAKPALVHDSFGQMRPIPQNNSDVIKFRKYDKLSQNTTALTEGTTPDGTQLSVTDSYATLQYYGDYTIITDKLMYETEDPVVMEALDVLGEQAGESLDSVTANILAAGTNVSYGGDATSRSEVATGDVVTTTLLDAVSLSLRNANAKKITGFVSPDKGYATTSVRPAYVGITKPAIIDKISGFTGWDDAETYANMTQLLPAEVGRYEDIRFLETTNAVWFEEEGASSADVYSIIVMGADAYGVTKLDGLALNTYVKHASEAGAEDPLEQRHSVGWKAAKVTKILNQNWIYRLEVTSA